MVSYRKENISMYRYVGYYMWKVLSVVEHSENKEPLRFEGEDETIGIWQG